MDLDLFFLFTTLLALLLGSALLEQLSELEQHLHIQRVRLDLPLVQRARTTLHLQSDMRDTSNVRYIKL